MTFSRAPAQLSRTRFLARASTAYPFVKIKELELQIRCEHATFGIEAVDCADLTRAYISYMNPHSTGAALRGWRRNCTGAYIVELDDYPVFNSADFACACTIIQAALLTHPKTTITLTLAPEHKEPMRDHECSPQIHVDQIRTAIRTLFEMREGRSITLNEMPDDEDIFDAIRAGVPLDDIGINSGPRPDLGNTPAIEYEEGTLPGSNWTRRRLRKLACWPKWKRAETIQLESMKKDGMYGPPCIAPSGTIVLLTVWAYYLKWDDTLKSCSCCDGSVLKGHGIAYTQHYTACISQPGIRILWAMVSIQGWITIGADAINAFAQADPPKDPNFVRIDDQITEWLEEVTGKRPDRTLVLPVLCALQGHPVTGISWANKVEGLLKEDLGFTSTTHETCSYLGSYGGQEVLVGR
jgi:hypothetical protein